MDCISQIPSNFLFLKKMRFFDHNVLEIICEIIQYNTLTLQRIKG